MRITHLSITHRETRSYGDHHSVSHEATLAAEIHDDLNQTFVALTNATTEQVHHAIDDTLDQNGEAPLYWIGTRFDVYESRARKAVAVIPSTDTMELPADFTPAYHIPTGLKFLTALQHGETLALLRNFQVYADTPCPHCAKQASDRYIPPLSELPPLPQNPAQPAGGNEDDEDDEPYFVGGDIEPDFSVIAIPA